MTSHDRFLDDLKTIQRERDNVERRTIYAHEMRLALVKVLSAATTTEARTIANDALAIPVPEILEAEEW